MESKIESFSFILNRKLFFGRYSVNVLSNVVKEIGSNVLFVISKSFSNSQRWNEIYSLVGNVSKISVETVSGEPTVEMVDNLLKKYRTANIDLIVSIGGGSVIDTGKALSVMLVEDGSIEDYLEGIGTKNPRGIKKPFIAVPTTFGTGSEATKNAVISKPGKYKKSLRHDNFVPDIAVIDPTLGEEIPTTVRIPSGLDALTQLIESYTSVNSNPYSDALCEKAFNLLRNSFEKVIFNENPSYTDFANVALGAYYSGVCLANVGLGVVHGFASVIGGLFNIPHGVICGKLLFPSTLKNIEKLKKEDNFYFLTKYATIGNLLVDGKYDDIDAGLRKLVDFLEMLDRKSGLNNLNYYGITNDDISLIVSKTSLKENPVKLSQDDLSEILVSVL